MISMSKIVIKNTSATWFWRNNPNTSATWFGEIIQKIKNTVGDMVSAKIQIVAAVKKYINWLCRFLGWTSSHQQTWTIEWKQTLNNRWSQQRRYVTGRLQWYPQDTAESFVKWSSAGLLHSPANVKGFPANVNRFESKKFYICSDVTHTHPACSGVWFFGWATQQKLARLFKYKNLFRC